MKGGGPDVQLNDQIKYCLNEFSSFEFLDQIVRLLKELEVSKHLVFSLFNDNSVHYDYMLMFDKLVIENIYLQNIKTYWGQISFKPREGEQQQDQLSFIKYSVF